ncbi:MAG: hypothetical protein ABW298_02520 [Candidatus Binatia bacterium]
MPEALGIYREERFSPGKVADDRAIVDAAAAELRRCGLTVRMAHPESLPSLDRPPAIVFAMCQSPAALAWLDEAAERTIVVNHPSAIRACYRASLVVRLDQAAVAQPGWSLAGGEPPADLATGPWLKRGDVHAMEAGDVRRVFSEEEWATASADLRRREVASAIVQRHVEGVVYKFYGVAGEFFRAFGLPPGREDAARALARGAAGALGLEVYGGDGVACADGSLSLIDFNDWPSFSRCRDEAGAAIGRRLLELLQKPDAHGIQEEHAVRSRT